MLANIPVLGNMLGPVIVSDRFQKGKDYADFLFASVGTISNLIVFFLAGRQGPRPAIFNVFDILVPSVIVLYAVSVALLETDENKWVQVAVPLLFLAVAEHPLIEGQWYYAVTIGSFISMMVFERDQVFGFLTRQNVPETPVATVSSPPAQPAPRREEHTGNRGGNRPGGGSPNRGNQQRHENQRHDNKSQGQRDRREEKTQQG